MSFDATAIERLQDAIIDGRPEGGRFKQDQLQALHKALREGADQICTALQASSSSSVSEVEAEYYLTMEAVKHFYDSIDFEKDLKDEYSVAHGKDNKSRRVGVGLVVIRPTSHTRLYSIATPLAAAIAAGNCVILEIPDTVSQLDSVLRTLLSSTLDPNTFCIVKSITDESVPEEAVLVDQTAEGASRTLTSQLLSSTRARCVAVVDRSANIEDAAKAITTARFSFGGSSPYAPDLVLVNEFVKKEFFEACSRYATLAFAGRTGLNKATSTDQVEETKQAIESAEGKKQVSTFGSNDFKLIDILDKNTSITNSKITGRYLAIATCSSLTDAIYNEEFENPLLAGYFFAEPGSAKYLAQFLPCHISLVNQIPAHLLVGPAAPIAHEPELVHRYSRRMFSVPRPQFAEKPSPALQKVEDLLLSGVAAAGGARKKSKVTTAALREQATKPLAPTGQSENKAIGFFETGILTGAAIYVGAVLPAVGYTTYVLGRKGFEAIARMRQ